MALGLRGYSFLLGEWTSCTSIYLLSWCSPGYHIDQQSYMKPTPVPLSALAHLHARERPWDVCGKGCDGGARKRGDRWDACFGNLPSPMDLLLFHLSHTRRFWTWIEHTLCLKMTIVGEINWEMIILWMDDLKRVAGTTGGYDFQPGRVWYEVASVSS